jgi:hypothetical protein
VSASSRPLCAETSRERSEPQSATASRIDTWLLVEYGGEWTYDPLDARAFAGGVRDHLRSQLAAVSNPRLLLIRRQGRRRVGPIDVFVGETREREQRFAHLQLGGYTDLLQLDLEAALAAGGRLEHPLLLACTHGKRDRCCARYGRQLSEALAKRGDPRWAWQCSHVGGDRFAGNLVCLPEGLYFGRVGPDDVRDVVDRYRAGRIRLDLYRGRSCYSFPVQAAEAHVRDAAGLDGLNDLRLVSSRRVEGGHWRVDLLAEVAGAVHSVELERRAGEAEWLTCKAREPREATHFAVVAHTVSAPD